MLESATPCTIVQGSPGGIGDGHDAIDGEKRKNGQLFSRFRVSPVRGLKDYPILTNHSSLQDLYLSCLGVV